MAEAMINHYLKDCWTAFSAGTHPSRVHPYAIKAMQEFGIDTAGLRSKSISEYWEREDLDLIVTVCDHARENCPAFYQDTPMLHMAFDDPVRYGAVDIDEAMAGFRKLRGELVTKLLKHLKELCR
jgi:arsenate reductase